MLLLRAALVVGKGWGERALAEVLRRHVSPLLVITCRLSLGRPDRIRQEVGLEVEWDVVGLTLVVGVAAILALHCQTRISGPLAAGVGLAPIATATCTPVAVAALAVPIPTEAEWPATDQGARAEERLHL